MKLGRWESREQPERYIGQTCGDWITFASLWPLIMTIQTNVICITHTYIFNDTYTLLRIGKIIETRNNRQYLFNGIVFKKSLVCVCLFVCFFCIPWQRGSRKKCHSPITKNKYLCYIQLPLQWIKQACRFIISIHRALSAPVNCYWMVQNKATGRSDKALLTGLILGSAW